jgi:hypothetical protein
MVFFNPGILMVFFSPITQVLFLYTYSFTGMNSYGEIAPPFLIKSKFLFTGMNSYGEIVPPFLIKSKFLFTGMNSYGEIVSPFLNKSKFLFTWRNSYAEIVSPFLIKSKFLWRDCVFIPDPIKIMMGRLCLHSLFNQNADGEIVSPFKNIESAVSDYLPEDSSFTEGSVNLELLLVIFPVLFICFRMSLHVHRLNCLYIYFFHYLFSGSGLSWFLIRIYGGSLFARTIISELLGCFFAQTFIFTLRSNSNPK